VSPARRRAADGAAGGPGVTGRPGVFENGSADWFWDGFERDRASSHEVWDTTPVSVDHRPSWPPEPAAHRGTPAPGPGHRDPGHPDLGYPEPDHGDHPDTGYEPVYHPEQPETAHRPGTGYDWLYHRDADHRDADHRDADRPEAGHRESESAYGESAYGGSDDAAYRASDDAAYRASDDAAYRASDDIAYRAGDEVPAGYDDHEVAGGEAGYAEHPGTGYRDDGEHAGTGYHDHSYDDYYAAGDRHTGEDEADPPEVLYRPSWPAEPAAPAPDVWSRPTERIWADPAGGSPTGSSPTGGGLTGGPSGNSLTGGWYGAPAEGAGGGWDGVPAEGAGGGWDGVPGEGTGGWAGPAGGYGLSQRFTSPHGGARRRGPALVQSGLWAAVVLGVAVAAVGAVRLTHPIALPESGTVPLAHPVAAAPAPDAPRPPDARPAAVGDPAGAGQPAGPEPVRLRLPDQGVTAPVVSVGVLPGGGLGVPDDPSVLGWWRDGARPGAESGTVVIDGHVDTRLAGEGALFALSKLAVGATVELTSTDGPRRYVVRAVRAYPKEQLPADVFDRTGAARLVLITCGGSFDRTTRQYADNIVVYATPRT
jgi:hypothetical protein